MYQAFESFGLIGLIIASFIGAFAFIGKWFLKNMENVQQTHKEERKELIAALEKQTDDHKLEFKVYQGDLIDLLKHNNKVLADLHAAITSLKDRCDNRCNHMIKAKDYQD